MKHLKVFAVLLFTMVAAPIFADQAQPKNLVDDVIRMAKAGVADDSIITFVQRADGRFQVTADDVIAMSDSNVSKPVIRAVVEESNARNSWRDRPADASTEKEKTTVHERTVYVSTPGYYYNPWYSSWYDPFWYGYGYGPRVSLGFSFGGFRSYGYHSYGGGRSHGGGHGRH